jgi:quinol monooxygenase YgiN
MRRSHCPHLLEVEFPMLYGYTGSMKTQPGQRQAVIDILLSGVERLREIGCHAYIVCEGDEDEIVVFEVWESKQHHDDSLQLPEVRAQIGQAMPMLTGEFSGRELHVLGGIGA